MSLSFRALRWINKNTPLEVKQTSLPIAKDGEGNYAVEADKILVKVKAAALNPIDILLKSAAIPGVFRAEKGFGLDYSGDIVAIGASAASKTNLSIGDRVCGINQNPFGDGTVAEYTLVNPFKKSGASIRKVPEKLTYEQAAAYPLVGGTAESMFENCRVQKFDKVLILGAGTSVGRYAVQFASQVYESKHVVVTCLGRTEPLARKMGATEVIDYTKSKNILNPVLESVKNTGKFDAILDCAGNSDLFGHMDDIFNENGSYITTAGDGKIDYKANPFGFLLFGYVALRNFRSRWGLVPYHYQFMLVDGTRKWPDRLKTFFEEKNIEIFIDSTYTLDHFDEAVARLESNKATGKVVITM